MLFGITVLTSMFVLRLLLPLVAMVVLSGLLRKFLA